MRTTGMTFYVKNPKAETVKFEAEGSFGKTSTDLLKFRSKDYFGDSEWRVVVNKAGIETTNGSFYTMKEHAMFHGITYGMYSKDYRDYPFWTCAEVSRKYNRNANDTVEVEMVANDFVEAVFGKGHKAITDWRDIRAIEEYMEAA